VTAAAPVVLCGNSLEWQLFRWRQPFSIHALHLHVQGASIPAVRPGRRTAEYITDTLMYMSVLGSVFLGLLAVRRV
jgi:SecY